MGRVECGGYSGAAMSALAQRPSLPPMPDLSHLTEEERKIIESVMLRQREEDEKEQAMLKFVDNTLLHIIL